MFESGLQHFVDTPESFGEQPDAVRRVLRDVPTVWDETQFLAGRPDEHVMIARRNGDREVTLADPIELDLLDQGGCLIRID